MIIPKSFQLAGININVIREDSLVETRKVIGQARYSKQEIAIDTKSAPKNITEQSFIHELVHWILYIMNEDDLRNNEKFVDTFAHILYQYIESKVDK